MNALNNKKTFVKLVVVYLLSSLIILSGCASTEKKASTNTTPPTNQKNELPAKASVEVVPKKVVPKKVVPKKVVPRKVAPIKASTKQEPKTIQSKEVELKPVVSEPPKKVEAIIKKKIEQSNTVEKAVPLPVISLDSLNQLPLSMDNGWVVAIKRPPLATKEACVLYHEKMGVFDGYKDNNIKLYLTLSQLLIKSDSNFDLSYPDTGIYVEDIDNNSSFYPLTLSSQKTIAALVLPLNDYKESSSINLVVKSGFWPSWPVTDTKTIMFKFNEVDSMIKTLSTCTSLLTAQ